MSDEQKDAFGRLMKPIPPGLVATRPGPGGMTLSYIEWHTAWLRITDVDPAATWEVISIAVHEGFYVHGRVGVLGVHRDGVGYAPFKGGDVDCGVKDAETDSLKRACVKFGVGISLYGADLGAYEGPEDKRNITPSDNNPTPERQPAQQTMQGTQQGGERKELNRLGKVCFAITKSLSSLLDAEGVTEDDVWAYANHYAGTEAIHDIPEQAWRKILDGLGKCQDKDRNPIGSEIANFANRVKGGEAFKDHHGIPEVAPDDDVPF